VTPTSSDTENPPGVVTSAPGVHRAWKIALISFSILVLELALIRQIPAQVRAISYFTNLLFMAAFSGMGLGCILQRQRSLAPALPAGLLLLFGFIWLGRGIVVFPEAHDVHYWLDNVSPAAEALQFPLFPTALAAFLLGALPFVALGQQLARSMDHHEKLVAYGWDIAGSLAGTLVFAICSLLSVPPWLWPPLVGAAFAAVFVKGRVRRSVYALAGVPFLLLSQSSLEALWSPYYYVQYQAEETGMRVYVNSSFHQFAIDFESDVPEHRQMQQAILAKWSQPYEIYRNSHGGKSPGRVLILGAGTGNDVYVARQNGALEITAVEIDPAILRLGIEVNPTRPYDDPRVRIVNDDARHFLQSTDQEFDMVVFGTLDSQSLLSSYSNLRLENYVYTAESLQSTRDILASDGMATLYYSVFKPWLYARIYSTVRHAFGDDMMLFQTRDPFLFNTVVVASKAPGILHDAPEVVKALGHSIPSVDDWPFIYLERPTLSGIYLKLFAALAVLMLIAFATLRRLHPVAGLNSNFFFLGLGFTLMQSSAIVRLALLFGSTWTVNAVVFSSALAMIWLANWMVLRGRAPSIGTAWPLLVVFVGLNALLPIGPVLALETPLRVVTAGLSIGVPVFFAAVCFSRLFARQTFTGFALGINLIGAMGGGLIEYLSMLIGMQAVWGVVGVVYLLAWLTTRLAEQAREHETATLAGPVETAGAEAH
jgi:hypothetical protein